ncbi:MAG: ABC transporter permease [Actinomycetota bacterium]|nr:ABC transporter permease [Actinomycetota bacterium]
MRETIRRILAIGRKEFIHIRRDPRMLFAVLAMPLIQLLLFAYAISFDVNNVPTVLLDGDRTTASRKYLAAYEQSDFFHVVERVDSMDAVDSAFDRSMARIAIMVRPGFGEAISRGEKGEVSVLVDGSEPNSAQLGQTYAVALNQKLGREVTFDWLERQGVDPTQGGRIEPRIRTWYNPERKSADFLIPGLLVVIIMIVTVQQTAVTLVKEKEQGTFEQIVVSPIRRGELMVGKVAPWVVLAFADMIGVSLVGMFVFGVPLRGDVLVLVASTFLFVLCSLAIGLLVSARASSVEVANLVALLISFLPGFMLSDFAFPLNSIPRFLQYVSYIFPGRYMVTISRSVFLKGAGFDVLWPQIGALALYAIVSLTLASLLYSRRAR